MSKTILIVDDDPVILDSLQFLLEEEGYSVITDTGRHVVEKVITYAPDVVLLDFLLSGTDGIEVGQKIRKHSTAHHTPIILLSAHPHAQEYAREGDVEDFLSKPFEVEELLRKIHKYIY